MRHLATLLAGVAVGFLGIVLFLAAGCSLDVPKVGDGKAVNIVLERHETVLEQVFQQFVTAKPESFNILSSPSTLSDFTCFAADIAGVGIQADSGNQIQNCTV